MDVFPKCSNVNFVFVILHMLNHFHESLHSVYDKTIGRYDTRNYMIGFN
jgi:hypothetical protein